MNYGHSLKGRQLMEEAHKPLEERPTHELVQLLTARAQAAVEKIGRTLFMPGRAARKARITRCCEEMRAEYAQVLRGLASEPKLRAKLINALSGD